MRILQRDFRDDKESTLREIYAVVHELDNGNFSRESSGVGGFPFFKFFRKEWRENMAINGPELKEIISDDARLFLGAAIPDAYLTDALGRLHGEAEALVFPTSTEEVSQILRYAHAHDIPVTPRGAGTNLVGSTIPLYGGIIVDLSRMVQWIISY